MKRLWIPCKLRMNNKNSHMNTRLIILKTTLWALVGTLAMVTVARGIFGLGATTALSDAMPWGYWNALKMSVVALAAGGFVLAGTVYVFGVEKYRCFVRPAILTAFLGYLTFVTILLYDLGLPWHIWHPIVYPQGHSVLFEVAICVMLYLTVLLLEFAPVILEYRWFGHSVFRLIHKILKRVTIPLVITGIVLSTLHQSSLGSLFLITPSRTHELWYSPVIWVLFFVSAVGLGLMMVMAESFFSAWFLGRKLHADLLSGLGRAASVVLFVYVGLRLGDLALRGLLGSAFDGSWQAWLFLLEISLSALVPATLLSFRRVRTSVPGLAICAGMTIFGMIGYRFNVSVVTFLRQMAYFPTWAELAASFGIVAAAMLVFIFFVERLKVYPEEHGDSADTPYGFALKGNYDPGTVQSLLPDSLRAVRRYSLAAIVAAAATLAFLPAELFSTSGLPKTPVAAARTVDGVMLARVSGHGHEISLVGSDSTDSMGNGRASLMMIDGNRNGRLVLFPHKLHVKAFGGAASRDTCVTCHHGNMPFDQNTSCAACHRDMYTATDIFNHASHAAKLGGNEGCAKCHADPAQAKTRTTATACAECHDDMLLADSMIEPPQDDMTGCAAGYMNAMHGLCVSCHEYKAMSEPETYGAQFGDCVTCHRDVDDSDLRRMKPYVVNTLATGTK